MSARVTEDEWHRAGRATTITALARIDSIRADRTGGDGIVVDLREGGVAIFSHGPSPMSLFEPDTGVILQVNDAWVATYGYSREEAQRMRVQDVSAEPDVTRAAVRDADEVGGAHIDVRWHRDRSGKVFPVELTSGTLRIGSRRLMYAVMHDISGRMRAEERLHASEARFRALAEGTPVGILVHKEGRLAYVNPFLLDLLRIPQGTDVTELSMLEFVHPEDRDSVVSRAETVEREGSSAPSLERRLVRRDGTVVWVETVGIPFDYEGPAVLSVVRDVNERKQMEARLLLADRLASLGRLAASVGHEINNPLAYVMGNLQLLRRDLEEAPGLVGEEKRSRLLDRLDIIEEGAARVRDIVRDLKALSASDRQNAVPVDLHQVLDVCANMAEHQIKGRARLVRDFGPPVWVNANETRLGQVFLNLLVNAAEAIPEGDATENAIRVATRHVDEARVSIEISDSGAGIPPEHLERIFEPFYTTKESGGTGLGLSISHTIVTSLGGSITATPLAPRGTCFRVTLPCETTAASQEASESRNALGRSQCLLHQASSRTSGKGGPGFANR